MTDEQVEGLANELTRLAQQVARVRENPERLRVTVYVEVRDVDERWRGSREIARAVESEVLADPWKWAAAGMSLAHREADKQADEVEEQAKEIRRLTSESRSGFIRGLRTDGGAQS